MYCKDKKDTIAVVDTSLLMNHPGIMINSKWCVFNVPMAALRQLDGLKDNDDPATRQRARIASRTIEEQRISIVKRYVKINDLENWGDNTIIGTALKVKEENPDKRVLLLTTDRNMRLVAGFYDLEAVDFWDFVKEDGCPAMKYPLWIKIWGLIAFSIFVGSWYYFSTDEVTFLKMFAGGFFLLFTCAFTAAIMRAKRLRQSVVEYYDRNSKDLDSYFQDDDRFGKPEIDRSSGDYMV